MKGSEALAALLLACVSSAGFAGVSFTKYPFIPAPLYFSSTNCRAQFRAQVTGMSGIVSWALYIGGEKTIEGGLAESAIFPDDYPPDLAYLPKITLTAMFDSTHFPTNSTQQITMRVRTVDIVPDGKGGVTLTNPTWHDSTSSASCHNLEAHQAPVKNRIAGHSMQGSALYYGGSAQGVNDYCPPNYDKIAQSGSYWTPQTYFAQINEGCNVSVYDGHGHPNNAEAGNSSYIDRITMSINRGQAVGTTPPINPSLIPPLNLLSHYSCSTANDNWKVALVPAVNAYGGLYENQSYLGFETTVYFSGIKAIQFSKALLDDNLNKGKSLLETTEFLRIQSSMHAYPYAFFIFNIDPITGAELPTVIDSTKLEIQGDLETTLKGVYNPYSWTLPGYNRLHWWRPL